MVYMREAISSVCQRHGLTACFLPKPFQASAGSGAHIHISMQDSDDRNIMGGILESLQGEGSIGESFMAGRKLSLASTVCRGAPDTGEKPGHTCEDFSIGERGKGAGWQSQGDEKACRRLVCR